MVDGDQLVNASLHACVRARVSNEAHSPSHGICHYSPMFPHLQRDNSDSGRGTVTGVIDMGDSGVVGSK